jgi:hypothetical protein
MSRERAFLRALGPASTGLSEATSLGEPAVEKGATSRDGDPLLPENWTATAGVVALSLLVLQAARWSIYLQPQFYFTKPLLLLACWAMFLFAYRWRAQQQRLGRFSNARLDWFAWPNLIVAGSGGLLLAAGPLAEWFNRMFQVGDPPEFLAFDFVLAVAMLLTVARSPRWRQGALVGSAFAALMVTFAKPDAAVYAFAILFGVIGLWRMMTTYWEAIESKAIGSTSRQLPFRFSILGMTTIVMLLLALVATAFRNDPLGLTSKWSVFSGGDQWSDPYATSGVGDGENLVAATKSAQSEGPIDSDMFIESKKRSLYDVISEQYGDKKPTPRTEHSQAVGVFTENYRHNHQRLAKVQKNTSSFQTTRNGKAQDRPTPEDVLSDALLLVTGPAPTHLTVETFDVFDGETWFKSEANRPRTMSGLLPGDDNEWYCLKRTDRMQVFQGFKTYQVAFLHLQSERIPTPPLTEAWSIGQVNQSRFYRLTADDGLEMTLGNNIPEFTLVRIAARGFRWRHLPISNFWPQARILRDPLHDEAGQPLPAAEPELELPIDEPAIIELQSLAAAWTLDAKPGWDQVTKIVDALRSNFQLDPTGDASLGNYLRDKKGPDFMFATAAVVALRTQGIPARLVSGFYVNPDHFDQKTGKTAVGAADAHFWAEVHVGDGNWLPIEPTPGYLPTPESLSWFDHGVQAGIWIFWWCVAYWPLVLTLCGAAVWSLIYRHWLVDLYTWTKWRFSLWLRPQHSIMATVRILERHAKQRGVGRFAYQPVGEWLSNAFRLPALDERLLSEFIAAWQHQRYGAGPENHADQATPQLCRQLVTSIQRSASPRVSVDTEFNS